MLAAMAATFAVVNHQLWTGIPTAANSLGSEFSRLSGGRQGGLAFLHSYRFWFVDLLTREPGTLILPPALFGVYLAISGRTRAAVGLAVSFFGSYLLILGFTPIPSQRYFVPAVFGMLYFAGLGTGAAAAAALNERKGPVRAGWIVGLSTYLVFTLGIALRDTRIQSQDFADPGLPAAWHWIRQNLAGQPVVLAQIGRNHLPGAGRLEDPDTEPLPGEILPFDPKTATYDSIKALGITHLIFRSIDRGDSLRNRGLGSDFFRELDSRGKLVFLVPQGGVSIIQPGIEVHEIH